MMRTSEEECSGKQRRDVVGVSLNKEYSQLQMGLITILWSMGASACLTLAGINLLIWWRNRKAWANLLFSLTAASTAASAFCELFMIRADATAEFATVLKWGHVAVLLIGRLWLAWTACGMRTSALLLDFLTGQNLNYRETTGLVHVRFLGESVTIAKGLPNPWMLVGQLSLVAWLISTDATVATWCRDNRHRALAAGDIVFFALVSSI